MDMEIGFMAINANGHFGDLVFAGMSMPHIVLHAAHHGHSAEEFEAYLFVFNAQSDHLFADIMDHQLGSTDKDHIRFLRIKKVSGECRAFFVVDPSGE